MKLLLLSQIPSINESKRGSRPFPSFQAQTFWLRALEELGHKVTVFRYSDPVIVPKSLAVSIDQFLFQRFLWFHHKIHQIKNRYYYLWPENWFRTQKLIHIISNIKPDLVIASGGIAHLLPRAFESAKIFGAKILLLHGEEPLRSATKFEQDAIGLFDLVVTNDPSHPQGWKQLRELCHPGVLHSRTIGSSQKIRDSISRSAPSRMTKPWAICLPYAAIDPTVHKKQVTSNKIQTTDVVFVGTLLPERQAELVELIRLGINLKVWGFIAGKSDFGLKGLLPDLVPYYMGEAWGKKAVRIYNLAKIVLNFVPDHMPKGGNMRTFEIPGSGAFQLTNRCPKEWFVPGKEVVIFSDLADLKTKIDYYLEHNKKRQAIAQAGYKRAHLDHTYQERFKNLLRLVTEN